MRTSRPAETRIAVSARRSVSLSMGAGMRVHSGMEVTPFDIAAQLGIIRITTDTARLSIAGTGRIVETGFATVHVSPPPSILAPQLGQ